MGKFLQFLGLQEAAVRETPAPQVLAAKDNEIERLSNVAESLLARLELARDNAGWEKILADSRDEFTRSGMLRNAELGRVFGLANPLIKRGRQARHAYIWGQGVASQADNPEVNDVVQAFLDDEGNREALFGAQATETFEGTLFDEGNYFIVCFTDPLTGRVQVRTVPLVEVTDIVSNPEDSLEVWLYERTWQEASPEPGGKPVEKKAYYPALKYQPATKARSLNGWPILWDAPIRHVKVNAPQGWKYGVGDSYAAIPWARSHKEFLENWALLMQALAKIAYTTSSKAAGPAQTKRAQIAKMGELPAGSVVSMTDDQKLEPVAKSGATLDSESSRPLATMAASAMGLPVTIVLADPGQTGARATAETLDLPTRLTMQGRQRLHTEVRADLFSYVIEQAVLAPRGPLRSLGRALRDGNRLKVLFTVPEDATVETAWPSLEDTNIKEMVDAIVAAEGVPDVPKLPLIRLLLQVLGIDNVDELLDEITDDDGNLISSDTNAGDLAAQAFRNGDSPAEALR